MNVESAYQRYLKLTGEPGAAASLVLAEVMAGTTPAAEVLSVNEAAEALNVHPQTVYSLCANGSLKHRKVGRQIRIKRADLDNINQPSVSRHW